MNVSSINDKISNFRYRLDYTFLEQPFYEKYLTTLFYGPRSACKSLHQAKMAKNLFEYLDNLYFKLPYLPQAIVISNQIFNQRYRDAYEFKKWDDEKKKYVVLSPRIAPRLFQFENIQQIKHCPRVQCWKGSKKHRLHNAYIIFDDIATIIPADQWALTPVWFRKIFSEAGHHGIHVIANLQDPDSCDINFRRYVDIAVKFEKKFGSPRPDVTKPKIAFIWGVYTTRSVGFEDIFKNGDMSEEQIENYLAQHPEMTGKKWNWNWYWIKRRDTEIYDTLQELPEYLPNSMEHIEMTCNDPKCGHIKVVHRTI